ncbi:MAG: YfhO family protein [Candidatus Saganbacteria bacterium]|nr:YfhO family protein [Candidatus Saganbacteria bacterium]
MKLDKKDLFIFGAFLVLVLVFFAKFLTGEQVLAFKDLSRYFYPLRHFMVEQVRAGQWPLWNPYIFCGFPLLATLQIGFFYPLSLLYFILPFNLAFNYFTILHYLLAACFMYLLLRYYQLSRAAAFLGGLVFAFSGYLLSVSNMNTSLMAVVWLPLVLLVYDSLLKQRTFLKIAGLASLLALQFLGGEPTIVFVTVFLLVAYAIVFAASRQACLSGLLCLAGAGLIALGLTAVQLLPFLELAGYSDRVARTAYGLITMRSFPPRELINFIFPYFFGNQAVFGGMTETIIGKNFQDWLISPYLGILPLVLVFFAFAKRRKKAFFFLAAAVIALLLAFGKYTPLYYVIYLMPGFSLIRYPVKYLFLLNFSLVVLAAFGFERLMFLVAEQREHLGRLAGYLLWLLLGMLGVFLAGFFGRAAIFAFLARNYSPKLPAYFFELLAGMIEFNLLSFFFVVVYLFGLWLLLFLAAKDKIKRFAFAGLLILLTAADLFANGSTVAVPVAATVFSAVPPNYQILLKDKGLFRFFYTPELEKKNRYIAGEDYNDALLETKDNFTANWHMLDHFFDLCGYESVQPLELTAFYEEAFKQEKLTRNLPYLSRFNVKYIASERPLGSAFLKLLRSKNKYGLEVYLYQNLNVMPRAYVLYGNKGPEWSWTRVKFLKYSPNEILISARAEQEDARLFLSEAYYPGWQAFVDGKEAEIQRANDFFRSVRLPRGSHTVRFVYLPLSFRLGGLISLLTVLGLLAGGAYYYQKARQS